MFIRRAWSDVGEEHVEAKYQTCGMVIGRNVVSSDSIYFNKYDAHDSFDKLNVQYDGL